MICTPTEDMTEQDLAGSEGGLHARGRAPFIGHIARPRKHRLGAVGAIGTFWNLVCQPRTVGDPERDQPHDGHGSPPGSERGRDERREGGGVPASLAVCQKLHNLQGTIEPRTGDLAQRRSCSVCIEDDHHTDLTRSTRAHTACPVRLPPPG